MVSVGFRGCFRARNLFPCSVVSVAHGTSGCQINEDNNGDNEGDDEDDDELENRRRQRGGGGY